MPTDGYLHDPENPPAEGIPADPLPPEIPEGDSGDVTDEGDDEPEFETFSVIPEREHTDG